MNAHRTCQQCSKEFVQTFGGRPRKKCYDCVPPRLHQKTVTAKRAGGQSHASARPNRATRSASASQKAQHAANPASTVGKHTGKSADPAVASSGVHCAYCGSYTQGEPFCNPQHRTLFAQKVADAKRGTSQAPLNGKVKMYEPPKRLRPIELVRQRREQQAETERNQQITKARHKRQQDEQIRVAA